MKDQRYASKPLCMFYTSYYYNFLVNFYENNQYLFKASYQQQLDALLSSFFGDSDFYSIGFKKNGWHAEDYIMNCSFLQETWAKEHQSNAALDNIVFEQIKLARPQVVYLHDLGIATHSFMSAIRPYTELIVGQVASPIFEQTDLSQFDIIFTSFPHFTDRFRKAGITSYYMPLAFDPRILEKIQGLNRKYPVTFVGGISKAHGKGKVFLEELAKLIPIDFWGYGIQEVPEDSPIKRQHHGEIWGINMFSLFAQSKITINRHIDVAENYANNMRLYEATGCGALLITDYKDNLNDLFEIGKEVVAYRSPEECAALIKYYLAHPEKAQVIAKAGQKRTLTDHTYLKRMEKTAEILERHLRYKREKNRFTMPGQISYGHQAINKQDITKSMTLAWQSKEIPSKQRGLVQNELHNMYHGQPPAVYSVMIESLKPIVRNDCSILEIGCASGYYYEVMQYLLNTPVQYTGVDYSDHLIDMAKDFYPKAKFYSADGANMPFQNQSFDIAISSCILLHTPNYIEHICETVRVAKEFVVVHRTPIHRNHPTHYSKKFAYGVETVELTFNENEILNLFMSNGLKLIEGLEYFADQKNDYYEVTYTFKRIQG